MDSTKYTANYDTHGIISVEEFIDPKYLDEAKRYFELFKSLTLSGKVESEAARTPEQVQIDADAQKLIKELGKGKNPALAYGFMLYNETAIVKLYWTQRCGKNRQDKREFFSLEKYLEWLTEIYTVLIGEHPKFHAILYYFKIGQASRSGKIVGTYDVMNSFRVFWNSNFVGTLARWMFEQDKLQADEGISIEAANDSENGYGNRFEAEMVKNSGIIPSTDQFDTFEAVENFLRSFTAGPLSEPVPLNTGTKSSGVTYKEVLVALVDGSYSSGKAAYQKFAIGPSIQQKILAKIKYEMKRHGFELTDFAGYLDTYRTVALDILSGNTEATFKDLD